MLKPWLCLSLKAKCCGLGLGLDVHGVGLGLECHGMALALDLLLCGLGSWHIGLWPGLDLVNIPGTYFDITTEYTQRSRDAS